MRKIAEWAKYGIPLACFFVVACGGPQQLNAEGALPSTAALRNDPLQSQMSESAKKSDLLYTTLDSGKSVYVYTYPSGKKAGTISGFQSTGGLCTDQQGNVFVVDYGAEEIVEYSHGGTTPIATLSDAGHSPFSCAVDPTTGHLAVTGGLLGSYNPGVEIYSKGSGSPTF